MEWCLLLSKTILKFSVKEISAAVSMKKQRMVAKDLMQMDYVYYLTEPVGKYFHSDFCPQLTPKEMLELGVFGGKYMSDCPTEFPVDWFKNAKLSSESHDPDLNLFGVNASQTLAEWRK